MITLPLLLNCFDLGNFECKLPDRENGSRGLEACKKFDVGHGAAFTSPGKIEKAPYRCLKLFTCPNGYFSLTKGPKTIEFS